MGVSCTLNMVTHQQIWSFCMKRGGERGETFHPHDTSELRFQVVGNRVKPALRKIVSSSLILCACGAGHHRPHPPALPRILPSLYHPAPIPSAHANAPCPPSASTVRCPPSLGFSASEPPWISRRQSEPPRIHRRQRNPGDAFPVEEGTLANIGSA